MPARRQHCQARTPRSRPQSANKPSQHGGLLYVLMQSMKLMKLLHTTMWSWTMRVERTLRCFAMKRRRWC